MRDTSLGRERPRALMAGALVPLVIVAAATAAEWPPLGAQWRPGQQARIVLLVDSSLAVAKVLTPFRAALGELLDGLPSDVVPEPEIVIVTSGGGLRVRAGPTVDREHLRAAASRFSSDGGGNAFLPTLLEADDRFFKSEPTRRSLLVILATDLHMHVGDVRVDLYNRFAEDFFARGGRAHAIVLRGLSTGATTQIAEHLTSNSGGFFETVVDASALPRVIRRLAQYVAADL